MDERDDDYDENLARWLKEAGHRRRAQSSNAVDQGPKESSDDLIRYLGELTGRKLTSREDIHRLLKDLCEADAEAARRVTSRRVVRETLLLVCVLAAYLQYYFWDVNLQIANLHRVQVFLPVPNDQNWRSRPTKAEETEGVRVFGAATAANQSAAAQLWGRVSL